MLYADNKGKIFSPEEIESLPYWKIETMELHVFEEETDMIDM